MPFLYPLRKTILLLLLLCIGKVSLATINHVTITGTKTLCAGDSATFAVSVTGGRWTITGSGSLYYFDTVTRKLCTGKSTAAGPVTDFSSGTITFSYVTFGDTTYDTIHVYGLATLTSSTSLYCTGTTFNVSSSSTGGTWSLSNATIASISSSTSLSAVVMPNFTGLDTLIFTNAQGCPTLLPIRINPTPPAITGSTSICKGASSILSVFSPYAGSWSSSNTSVATIGSSTGIVTGVNAGIATISFIYTAGCYTTATVTINSVPAAISGPANVYTGGTITLSDATSGGSWSSDFPSIATINSSGIVSPVSSGLDIISYTLPGGCASVKYVNVNPLPDSDLVAWYPFCHDTIDHSGNGYDLLNNFPGHTPAIDTISRFGVSHDAFSFSGNSYMYYTAYFPLNAISGGFTYSAWIYPYSSQGSIILYNGNPNSDGFGFVMNDGSATLGTVGNYVGVYFGGTGAAPLGTVVFNQPVALNQWHNLLLERVGSGFGAALFKFYVDNTLVGSMPATMNLYSTGSVFGLGGANPTYGGSFLGYDGRLDDISVYTRIVTSNQLIAFQHFNPDVIPFSLGPDDTVCNNFATLAPDTTTIGVAYAWSTGDTVHSSISIKPTLYLPNDQFILTQSKPHGCSVSDTVRVTYIQLPVHIGNDTNMCNSDVITLNAQYDTTNTHYYWNTGDTTQTINVNYTGTFIVRVDSGGCEGLDTINIYAARVPLITTPSLTYNCTGDSITLATLYDPGYVYLWNDFSTADTLRVGLTGIYSVKVNDSGCVRTKSITVEISVDSFIIRTPDTAVCLGGQVHINDTTYGSGLAFQWLPTAGVDNPNSAKPIITPDTSAYYTLTATIGMCSLTRGLYIEVQPNPSLYMGGNRNVCQFDTIRIWPTVAPLWYPDYIYDWTPGTYLNDSTTPYVIYNATDTFATNSTKMYLTVTTPAGCKASDSIMIYVHHGNFLVGLPDGSLCPGDSMTIITHVNNTESSDSSTYTYAWHPGVYLNDSNAQQPVVKPITTTPYTLIATSPYGCKDTMSFDVVVKPAAVMYMEDSVVLYSGETYQISPQTNATSFSWYPAIGLSDTSISNPVASPPVNTKYIVTATTEDGCEVQDSIKIRINPYALVAMPNAFTPGGSVNKIFAPIKRGNVRLNYFHIFDQWGNMVYDSKDIDAGWDGTYKGQPQPFAVYVYEIETVSDKGKIYQQRGNVTLIR